MNIFDKCFWKGHTSDWIENPERTRHIKTCRVCHKEVNEDDTAGKKFLDVLKTIGVGAGVVIGGSLLVGLIFLVLYSVIGIPTEYLSCRQFANQNGLPYVYKFWYGCLVNYSGHWVNPDMLVQLLK